ncbi:class I SAM-dependent methyltransferase [Bacillus sp. BRMEA1]|uniref:class I SAM-dependent methyltransferase n=1 Tax=Neobacillus endophyticus TaxID=2738405 RepID=UPI001564B8D8|nr:class I SAM-dependent methyltransferase [Neobacillus endophyticus]NRD75925.1 class I SAM-dependent methyltransferase [Neobacillus endophyticus]
MGREFLEIFEEWADSYDDTVVGRDIEYKEVFSNYEQILTAVAQHSFGHVLEFGVGTGNLTNKLLEHNLKVTGIEPSPSMRRIAGEKLGNQLKLLDGDFLVFPVIDQVDTIVSTYAFHHLTDEEKAEAIGFYGKLLSVGGKIVFADTMFESEEDYKQQIVKAKKEGFLNLAQDLETEYYTTIPLLEDILKQNGFSFSFQKYNEFVWLMEGVKQ